MDLDDRPTKHTKNNTSPIRREANMVETRTKCQVSISGKSPPRMGYIFPGRNRKRRKRSTKHLWGPRRMGYILTRTWTSHRQTTGQQATPKILTMPNTKCQHMDEETPDTWTNSKYLKILQINLNKSEKVHLELINSKLNTKWDIVLIQEPHNTKFHHIRTPNDFR